MAQVAAWPVSDPFSHWHDTTELPTGSVTYAVESMAGAVTRFAKAHFDQKGDDVAGMSDWIALDNPDDSAFMFSNLGASERLLGRSIFGTNAGNIREMSSTSDFQQYFSAKGESKAIYRQRLLQLTPPESLLSIALQEYRVNGNYERLALTANMLAQLGTRALPALAKLVKDSVPEMEYFLDVLINIFDDGAGRAEAYKLLRICAIRGDRDTKLRLIDLCSELPHQSKNNLLLLLAQDEDEDVAIFAEDRLDLV